MKLSRSIPLCFLGGMLFTGLAVYFGCLGMLSGCVVSLALAAVAGSLLWKFILHPICLTECAILRASTSTPSTMDQRLDRQLESLLEQHEQMIKQEYSLQMLKKQAELHALQSQINPHFLYNTLDSIRGYALMQDLDEIADMTEALSTFFRYNISSTGSKVTLEDELENVENYMTIQQFRFGDRIRLSIELETSNLRRYAMPKMTLQPVVENAVLHGLETTSKRGTVVIQVQAVDDRMEIYVRDDGIGMSDEELQRINDRLEKPDRAEASQGSRAGIALTNVCQRIQLCYGPEYGMHVFSTANVGTEVLIILPLDLYDPQEEAI